MICLPTKVIRKGWVDWCRSKNRVKNCSNYSLDQDLKTIFIKSKYDEMSLLVKPWLAEHPDAWFQRGREGGGGTGRGKDQSSSLLASPHLLWWGWWLLSHRHDILMIKIMMALSGPGDQWSCVLFSHHLPWSMHYDDNDINDEEMIGMIGQLPRCLEKTVWWLWLVLSTWARWGSPDSHCQADKGEMWRPQTPRKSN